MVDGEKKRERERRRNRDSKGARERGEREETYRRNEKREAIGRRRCLCTQFGKQFQGNVSTWSRYASVAYRSTVVHD